MSLFSFLALSIASCPQGYHWTGLWACCSKYGDFSEINVFVYFGLSAGGVSVLDEAILILVSLKLLACGGSSKLL